MKKELLKEIFSWIMVFVIAFVLAMFINRVVIYRVKIPTGSMENTIMVGDKVITFRLAYLFSEPKRGDIIVFPYPDDEEVDYIKRIVGLPGETIEGKMIETQDGEQKAVLLINDEIIEESYLKEQWNNEVEFGPYTIPEDCYFMMGDNRNISADARFWTNKFVHKDKIYGKAILKYPDFKWLN